MKNELLIYGEEELYNRYGLKQLEEFNFDYSSELNYALQTPNDIINYQDMRTKNIYTIDGEYTLDMDDAISISKLEKYYQLIVYIADVSKVVREDSMLDKEARKRGTSYYFPRKTFNMLPKLVSQNICSLKENEERNTIAIYMLINEYGLVEKKSLFFALINSKKKMSYNKVYEVLKNGDREILSEYSEYVEDIYLMKELALILEKRRKSEGAIELNIEEPQFVFDKKGQVINVLNGHSNLAHNIIKEFMLVANQCVAIIASEYGIPFIYRCHEQFSDSEFERLKKELKYSNLNVNLDDINSAKDVYKLLSNENTIQNQIVSRLIYKYMHAAKYTSTPNYHFALSSSYYCHFTSPIRRYPDVFNHRMISQIMLFSDINKVKTNKYFAKAEEYSRLSSEAESRAKSFDRKFDIFYKDIFLQNNPNKIYKAFVYDFCGNGIKIKLCDYEIEGKLAYSKMTDVSVNISMLEGVVDKVLLNTLTLKLGSFVYVKYDGLYTKSNSLNFKLVSS